jgi:hypothetical protein
MFPFLGKLNNKFFSSSYEHSQSIDRGHSPSSLMPTAEISMVSFRSGYCRIWITVFGAVRSNETICSKSIYCEENINFIDTHDLLLGIFRQSSKSDLINNLQ